MEYKYKNNHNQVLNPFIGFGWFTGMSASKSRSDSQNEIFNKKKG